MSLLVGPRPTVSRISHHLCRGGRRYDPQVASNKLIAVIIQIDINIFVEYVDARFRLASRSVNTGLMSPNRARHKHGLGEFLAAVMFRRRGNPILCRN